MHTPKKRPETPAPAPPAHLQPAATTGLLPPTAARPRPGPTPLPPDQALLPTALHASDHPLVFALSAPQFRPQPGGRPDQRPRRRRRRLAPWPFPPALFRRHRLL